MNKNAKIVKTKDGSDTLYLPDLDEHYHSTHGARQESEHVYIKMGLDFWAKENSTKKEVRILEVGFGTGINALITKNFADKNKIKVNYTTLEPFPFDLDLINQLNFNFNSTEKEEYIEIHKAEWNVKLNIFPNFELLKINQKIEEFDSIGNYDIIYFDAFAPNKQKNIWSTGNLLKLKSVLEKKSGILVTYCAQGQFKRDAKEVGFKVTSLKGPPGKFEISRLNI